MFFLASGLPLPTLQALTKILEQPEAGEALSALVCARYLIILYVLEQILFNFMHGRCLWQVENPECFKWKCILRKMGELYEELFGKSRIRLGNSLYGRQELCRYRFEDGIQTGLN